MPSQEFRDLIAEQAKKGGGWRAAAKAAGVSHVTLLKAAGKMEGELDLRTLDALSRWLQIPMPQLALLYAGGIAPNSRLSLDLERLTRKYPELVDVLSVAADLGEDELREALNYIRFRSGART